ncbi:TPA: ABC transporter ATP-binding protein [Candidatus Woesearchaeota archaeon]|nr:ABC transporter ATP-binding protein [Candidatus Woesearchaeota archaeon]
MARNLVFTVVSVSLVALFPLLTQFYIRIAYNKDVSFLVLTTVVVAVIYFLKLLMDIHLDRFENKFFIKLRSNLQEGLIRVISKKRRPFDYVYNLVERKTKMYVLFVQRVVFGNFKSLIRVIAVLVTIIFFDRNLFIYCLFFIPVFVLYLVLFEWFFRRNEVKVRELSRRAPHADLTAFLAHEWSGTNLRDGLFSRYVHLKSLLLEKDIRNRNSLVALNQSLRASITFFRVIYLSYFGYFIISEDVHIAGLIVGLLFLTILIRSFTNILETMLFYHITKDSVIKIQKMLSHS